MHFIDAGNGDGFGTPYCAQFQCRKCGRKSDWFGFTTITEIKRGIPCDYCNGVRKRRRLVLHVKDIYFQQTLAGLKPFEFRLRTPYWTKRLVGQHYDDYVLMSGYPAAGDTSKILVMPYRGYEEQTITHPHFGDGQRDVFAIIQEVQQ
ncbi:hypothetical protein [Micavibrio aeruginosavorus]|nr:hypothetical protein [Micavibrio aeruginosavorus]